MMGARAILALVIVAAALYADSRNQTFDDFTTPLPLQRGETLVLGIVGGWERWDHPLRCIRRTAIEIKRRKLPGVWVETVENQKLELGERLIRNAFDFNADGTLSREEARDARLILFGQSLGGRALLWLCRTLNEWEVPVQLAFVVDAYGKDSYLVPPNVNRAANIYQADHILIKGAPELIAEDPAATEVLYNRRMFYRGRAHEIETPGKSGFYRLFMGAHLFIEYDREVWDAVIGAILAAIPAAVPDRRPETAAPSTPAAAPVEQKHPRSALR